MPEIRDRIRALRPDALVVIAFGQKLGPELLDGLQAFNLHASLLPAYRGAAPINRAMLQLVTLRNVAEPGSVERHFGFRPRPLYGNIDHVRSMTAGQAIRINLGLSTGS